MFFNKFQLGSTYACQTGKHAGKMFTFIDKNKHEYGFLVIPIMENYWIPIHDFEEAIENKIVEYVERVPKKVRQVAKAKFIENKEIIRSAY